MWKERSSVVVAISGGIDSALAAALLKESGWEVTVLHFILPADPLKQESRRQAVREVADHLQVRLFELDLRGEFAEKVVGPFARAYMAGLTPNPCVICNEAVKFRNLVRFADERGLECIATGHYAIIEKDGRGAVQVWRGVDGKKEQSYFLNRLNQTFLKRAVLPLGGFTKPACRRRAAEMGLPVAFEPESSEICFIPGNDYRHFLEQKMGDGIRKRGDILDTSGLKVGEHLGTYRYTVGQRHGLGIASISPFYVKALAPDANQVIVGRKEELFSREVKAACFNWLSGGPPEDDSGLTAQVRYRHRAAAGRLEVHSPDRVRFVFQDPQWAVTPGQSLAVYKGRVLLGGGWISR